MTLQIPLEHEDGSRGFRVDAEEGYVRLDVELASGEFLGRPFPELDDLVRTRLDLVASRAHEQATTVDQDDAKAIFDYLVRLESSIDALGLRSTLGRTLTAPEARAVAAVLEHFAREVER